MAKDLQVLHTLYDNLFDAITYAPSTSQPPPFDKKSSMIQFASMQAINEKDFANAFSPMNPNGDMKTAEAFSRLVDALPLPQVLWADSGSLLSTTYKNIVDGANSSVKTDPGQLEIYNNAYNYLNVTQTLVDFMKKETTQVIPSPIFSLYQSNLQSYVAALSSYRLTYNNFNLDDPKQQRDWMAREPVLAAAINSAWNSLQQGGAPMVQQALAAMTTTINSAIRDAINQSQQTMTKSALASMTGGASWYLAYATPSNWAAESAMANMTQLKVDSGSLQQSADASFDKWGGGVSAGWGLWSIGGNAGGSSSSSTAHMTSTSFTMTSNIEVVRIYRPWYNPSLFKMDNWFTDAYKMDKISDGKGEGAIPMIPTALIVARDFELKGTFSTEDKSHIESAVNGGASVGWGPFQIGGSYAHSESHDRLSSSFDGTTLKVPGIQVIGYVNAITPACPPSNTP